MAFNEAIRVKTRREIDAMREDVLSDRKGE